MISRAITVVALASLTCVHALAAQAGPDMVPMEFVRMLMITPFTGTPQVTVGRLPDRLANDLAPGPDTRIVGSLGSARFTASALVMPGRAADVQERLVARLVEKGWKKLPAPPPEPRGGFETEVRERGAAMSLTLCSSDDHNVQLIVSSHRGDSAEVRLFLGRGGLGATCVDPELTSAPPPPEYAPIPALRAPTGTEHRGGGSSSGMRDGSAEGRLRTDMEPAKLLDHYAAQMTAAGWQQGARTTSAEVALQVFLKTDERASWRGVLYVIAVQNGERDLHVRVTRAR
jgi:hypothetical protein